MGYWKHEWKALLGIVSLFLACFYLPVGRSRFDGAVLEALHLVKWYAREHVLLCLVPSFFIAGAISVFVSQTAVMKHLGPGANKALAYGVASVSGTILAVCSCTVLPLFAGIYRMGAGLGPASTFLYSGPAINVLAIILTARVLGLRMGAARAAGAVVFSVVVGLAMHLLFRKEELEKLEAQAKRPPSEASRPLWQMALHFGSMVAILVFANWARPAAGAVFWEAVFTVKWTMVAVAAAVFAVTLAAWFGLPWRKLALGAAPALVLGVAFPAHPELAFAAGALALAAITSTQEGEPQHWFIATWGFAKQILPLLLAGVLVAGVVLGRPGRQGLVPSSWITNAVGGNSLGANLFASVAGAFMYFATLTEVPILQGLLANGMGQGPALALLLAGPALSLPSMLVLHSLTGTKKTMAFCTLVVIMSAVTGLLYGELAA